MVCMCMFCINCGACGKKIPQELQDYYRSFEVRSNCGANLKLGQLECPICHHSVLDNHDRTSEVK